MYVRWDSKLSVWLLSQPGLDLNWADGWNALHYACVHGRPLSILKRLVDIGVDLNMTSVQGSTYSSGLWQWMIQQAFLPPSPDGLVLLCGPHL